MEKDLLAAKKNNTSNRLYVARDSLILGGRGAARKMAGKLLKRWNAHLPEEEIVSICHLALCEAARCFDPERGAGFLTYLYFYLRGCLISEFSSRANSEELAFGPSDESMSLESFLESESVERPDFVMSGRYPDPETEACERETRRAVFGALNKLEKLERKVLVAVFYQETKVAKAARKMGYSRGYLSDVKTGALKKLREHLYSFREAA